MAYTTGLDLKIERLKAHLEQREIARRMGVSSNRVSNIETANFVTPEAAKRYREALAQALEDATRATEALA